MHINSGVINATVRRRVLITDVLLSVKMRRAGCRQLLLEWGIYANHAWLILLCINGCHGIDDSDGFTAVVEGGDDAGNGRGGGCRSFVVSMVPESARRRRRARWPGSSSAMLAGVLCCWQGFDRRMMPSKKKIGDAATVIDDWINSFGLNHKNRALMMLWLGLKMVDDQRRERLLRRQRKGWSRPSSRLPATMPCGLDGSGVSCLSPTLPDGVPSVDGSAGDARDGGCRCRDGGDVVVTRWGLSDLKGVVDAVVLSGSDS
ncbi:hypothetical protein ACLOJK_004990 [Asimina triloba]